MENADDAAVIGATRERELKLFEATFEEPLGAAALNRAIDRVARANEPTLSDLLKPYVLRAVTHYLTEARSGERPVSLVHAARTTDGGQSRASASRTERANDSRSSSKTKRLIFSATPGSVRR